MSNVNTITAELIPRIMAGPIDVLSETFEMVQHVRQDFSPDAAVKGDSVTFNASTPQTISSVSPSNVAPNLPSTTLAYRKIYMNSWNKTNFAIDTEEATRIITGNYTSPQMEESMRAIAQDMNAACLAVAYKNTYGYAGSAGTNPFASNLSPMVDSKDKLDRQLCPKGKRFAVIGPAEFNAALKLDSVQKALNLGDNTGIRDGVLKNLFGIDTVLDQQRPLFAAGTGTSYVVNGTNSKGSTSLVIKTGSGTVVTGDILTLQGDAQTYVVVTGVSAAGTVTISPALAMDHSDGDTVSILGAGTSYASNFVGDPGFAGLAVRGEPAQIEGFPTMGEMQVVTDPKTGIPVSVTVIPTYKSILIEVSVLYGVDLLDARRGCRLVGGAV